MKNIRRLGLAVSVCVLAGCSSTGYKLPDWVPSFAAAEPAPAPAAQQKTRNTPAPGEITFNDGNEDVTIQIVDFRSGISSATVERLAKRFGCTGTTGAGLITEKGPVEVYRMKCDNGTTFLAQCELRQCRPMR
jgi:hypothetical protein